MLGITLALLAYGLIVLNSASQPDSYKNFGNTTHYILHQILYGGLIGLVALYVCSRLDYHLWLKHLPLLLIISLGTLVLVKIPPFGFSAGGAARWIHLGPLFFQPSELAKLVIIIYLSAWIDKKRSAINDLYFGLLPSLIIVGLFALLILFQPDFGTMLTLIIVAASLLFVAGISWKYFFSVALIGLTILYLFARFEPYRARRLTAFLNPQVDPQGISYQINQALLAIGSGSLTGYGYGLSRQKYNYLPQPFSDSIFAILAEELGFLGVVIVLALFLGFAIRGFQIARHAPDLFGKMMGVGITSWIVLQAFINIGAMVNVLPLTGIPLPFFSYGSTSLIVNLAAVGILLNISRQAPIK